MCVQLCLSLYTTVVHNTAQNSSDNFPSCPPDSHHSSDGVYGRGGQLQETFILLHDLFYFTLHLWTAYGTVQQKPKITI